MSAAGKVRAFARRPWGSVLVGAAAVAVVVGAGTLAAPTATSTPEVPVVEPVASAELLCPITVATSALVSTVSAGVAPVPGVDSEGTGRLAALSATPDEAPKTIDGPGQVVTDRIEGDSAAPRTARATGSWAAGFGADQVARSGEGATRGLAASPCARPITDGWILGGASTVGRTTQILLVNDDDRAAQVDLLVYGPDGEVVSPAGSGVVVPPFARSVVRLSALAPDQKYTAIHVVARTGRIAVSALQTAAKGFTPLGMSVLPVTQAGRRVVIPDIPKVASARLLLLSPDGPAEATVRLVTRDGSITPVGLDALSLEQNQLRPLSLTAALAGDSAGVVVTADVPVVAAVIVTTGTGSELREGDVTAGTPALTAPGIVTGLGLGTILHVVGIAAPGAATSVRLDVYVGGSSTPAWTRTADVPAGSSMRVRVTVDKDGSLLVITPLGKGPAYVTREVTERGPRGPLLALAPVLPTRATTTVPPVVQRPGSSLR
ncbi:MAG: DUF5719 family protein [Candidatus Nanopelagicales bacterium]